MEKAISRNLLPTKQSVIGAAKAGLFILVTSMLAGCAHVGQRVERGILPEGTPDAAVILQSLAENDAAIRNFKATGAFRLEAPDLGSIKRFRFGTIAFRQPGDLSVVGRHDVTQATIFRLTSVGSEFLIEFPSSPDKPYYQLKGERIKGVPFSVSPSDVAKEMVLSEVWSELKPDEVRIVHYDPAVQTVVMEIGPRRSPRRRLTVQGPPWDVIKNERLDKHGDVIAETTRQNYEFVDGIRFPMEISAFFPTKNSRMTFSMRKVQINTELEPDLFDIKSRALEAGVHF